MYGYVFASSDESCVAASASVEALLEVSAGWFLVSLANDDELRVLMRLLGIVLPSPVALSQPGDFDTLFDYSDKSLPMLDQAGFEAFYEEWLSVSGREGSMDEYGQLLFLQGLAADWNTRSSCFILRESLS